MQRTVSCFYFKLFEFGVRTCVCAHVKGKACATTILSRMALSEKEIKVEEDTKGAATPECF